MTDIAGVSEATINALVKAWLQADGSDASVADQINKLPEDARREVMIRLGYNTPNHLRMFGLG